MTKRPKNLDLNELAKRIVDEATGETETEEVNKQETNKKAEKKSQPIKNNPKD